MMRWLVSSSLRGRKAVVLVGAVLLAFGFLQLRHADFDSLPEFDPPIVEVQTEALGLSAEEMEQLITTPLEQDLLNGVAWLDSIRSQSVPGLSNIVMEFEPGTDLYRARQVVQERLNEAHALPNVSRVPAMLQPQSSTSRALMVSVTSDELTPLELGVLARWTIVPRLTGVPGVSNVVTWGQKERQLQVQVDPERLADAGVTLDQVIRTTGNSLWASPLTFLEASTPGTGGFIDLNNQRLGVQHLSPIETAEELAQVAIEPAEGAAAPAGSPLRLGDVADVVEDHQPLIGEAVLRDGDGMILVVEKLPGASTTEVTEGVEDAIEAMRPGLSGVDIDTGVYRPATYVDDAADNLRRYALDRRGATAPGARRVLVQLAPSPHLGRGDRDVAASRSARPLLERRDLQRRGAGRAAHGAGRRSRRRRGQRRPVRAPAPAGVGRRRERSRAGRIVPGRPRRGARVRSHHRVRARGDGVRAPTDVRAGRAGGRVVLPRARGRLPRRGDPVDARGPHAHARARPPPAPGRGFAHTWLAAGQRGAPALPAIARGNRPTRRRHRGRRRGADRPRCRRLPAARPVGAAAAQGDGPADHVGGSARRVAAGDGPDHEPRRRRARPAAGSHATSTPTWDGRCGATRSAVRTAGPSGSASTPPPTTATPCKTSRRSWGDTPGSIARSSPTHRTASATRWRPSAARSVSGSTATTSASSRTRRTRSPRSCPTSAAPATSGCSRSRPSRRSRSKSTWPPRRKPASSPATCGGPRRRWSRASRSVRCSRSRRSSRCRCGAFQRSAGTSPTSNNSCSTFPAAVT